ncbi:hypothetical protein [Saccharospirillum salsuginis]|uniref:Uncharacterized protein n=1 Tax=Saccharospirillum salsuginis TaxID=418750 RepID=A0A918NAR8_9GAMM|nr:hypothetical protein [Saccharospirillum salsuginis]GGX54185.1 hypothetical protein GCM10007392_21890 [Saccharospirillum salsuginis]
MQKLHVLTRVPEHIVDTPSHITGQQRWQRSYNVAGWIRFERQDDSPVRLLLRVQDAAGARDVPVDNTKLNSKTLLLSGVANLKLTGRIERMELLLQSEHDTHSVDELFVQPVKEKAKTNPARRVTWGVSE